MAELMQAMIDNEVAALNRRLQGEETAKSGNDDLYGPSLVINTLNKRYDYLLNHADLVLLLPFFSLKKRTDDWVEVVGDPEVLRHRLQQHVQREIGTLIIILHQPPIHWATLVVCNGSLAFFADSMNKMINDQYKPVIKQFRKIINIKCTTQLQQASNDGINCGFWALQNAEAIRSWIADSDQSQIEKGAPRLLQLKQDEVHDYFVKLREKMMGQLITHYNLSVVNLQLAINKMSAVQSSPACLIESGVADVCEAESMDFDDDMDEAPTELFSTRVQDHEESEQVNHRFKVIDYETIKADIEAERRVVFKDVDSVIFVSKKAETFTAGTGRLDYPLTDLFPLPEKNTKVISVLMERQKIISNDDYRWSVMRFGNYGMKTVYFTFYHHKSMPIRLFRKQFSCEIVKSALKQCVVPSDETSTQQSLNFNEHGAGYIRIYRRDWPKVSRAIDDQLTNWSYFVENQIDHFYFYTAEHGMQDDRKDAILLIAAEMNVNINCHHLVLIQAHIARTLTALENELLIIKTKDVNKTLKSEANMKCALVRSWFTKFITDAGHVTVSYKFSSPYTRTHGQTYHPSERLISKMGRGLLIHYLGLGGASSEYFPEHKTITKFRENARTQMCLLEQYEQVGIDGRIRVEDVHSAETFKDLTNGIDSKKHLLRHLAKNNCLLSFSPWPQYLHMSIGSEIKLLRRAFDEVEQHGCCRLTQSTIIELHKAESKLKYFITPHKFKTFDYQMAKKMIEKGEIKRISFEKSSTPIDHDDDVNDNDALSDMMSDHEEGGEEVVYDDRNLLPDTQTSDQNPTSASRKGCPLDSIDLRKFSGHVLVTSYVPTLLKLLPEDCTTEHPLQSVDGKINWIFKVIASVARLIGLDGSACDIFVQNPKTAFKEGAIKAFISRHKLQNSVQLKGTITSNAVTECILRPDKMLPCILLSFTKLNVGDKIVKSKIRAFINEHVDYFPNSFLVKGILHGGYATNRWWKVPSSREAFPDATADDSSAIRQERNLTQNQPVSQKMRAKYSGLKNHEVWMEKKLNKGRRKTNIEKEKRK